MTRPLVDVGPSHDHTRLGLYAATLAWFICTALQTSQVDLKRIPVSRLEYSFHNTLPSQTLMAKLLPNRKYYLLFGEL
jgi:hypothetical protein